MNYLDETLTVIYIQEDLKLFSKDKVKQLVRVLKNPTEKSIETAAKLVPNTPSLNSIEMFVKKKSPEFKKSVDVEKRKARNMTPENSQVYALTITSLNQLRNKARIMDNEKMAKIVDNLILKVHFIFKKYGTLALQVGIIVKIIAILGKYLWELGNTFPILFSIFNISAKVAPYTPYAIAAGIILLILAWLLKLWYESRQEEREYKDSDSNPYTNEV